jgi:hypothetical protein
MEQLPRLGLGCAPLGNLYHSVPEEQALAVVEAAFDTGCTYLDTAPHYGLGLSEERLGRALAGRDRSSYVLSTKVGRRLRPLRPGERVDGQGFVDTPPRAREWDLSRDGIRATLEASLERLGTDHVDIVYLHDVEDRVAGVVGWTDLTRPVFPRNLRSPAVTGSPGPRSSGSWLPFPTSCANSPASPPRPTGRNGAPRTSSPTPATSWTPSDPTASSSAPTGPSAPSRAATPTSSPSPNRLLPR